MRQKEKKDRLLHSMDEVDFINKKIKDKKN
jgi:hypothetical protein